MKRLIKYFTEPYRRYDGEFKGLFYYQRMADRREAFRDTAIMILVIGLMLLLISQANF